MNGRTHGREVCESDWRASSVPAAAVIPTPRVSMMDAAVKKSVVMVQLNGVDQGRMWCNGWRIGQGA